MEAFPKDMFICSLNQNSKTTFEALLNTSTAGLIVILISIYHSSEWYFSAGLEIKKIIKSPFGD